MGKKDNFSDLRKRAEKIIGAGSENILESQPPVKIYKLIHELNVQQIELGMQNDELRRSQLELQKARDEYSGLFDFAPLAYFKLSHKGIILKANLTGASMLGIERAFLIGKAFNQFISKDTQDTFYLSFNQLIKKKTPQAFELKLVKNDDTFFHAQLESKIVQDDKGNYNLILLSVIDITERKQAEQRKKLNIEILETINKSEKWKDCIKEILDKIKQFTGFEAVGLRLHEDEDFPYYATIGFPPHFVEAERYLCTRDSKGEMIRDSKGNPYVECMCGNVICGRTDANKDFFSEDGSFWSNNTSKLLSETTDEDRQTRTRNRCNSEGYESVALFPLKVGHEILGLLQINDTRPHQFTEELIQFFEGVGVSIGTAFSQKRAKDALLREKLLSEEYINSLPGLFYIFDEQEKLVKWNKLWIDVTGYSNEKLTSMTATDFFKDGDKAIIRKSMVKVFQEGSAGVEAKLVTKNGQKIPYHFTGLRKKLNGKDHLIGLGIDISEHKKLEGQLRQSSKMESIGTIAGGIAHDFNNILYMILGNAELALEDIPEWNPVHDSLKEIKSASLRAAAIIKQLLNFSRKTDQEFKPIRAVKVIRDTMFFLRSMIPTTIEIRKHLPNEEITILGDPTQINQMVTNFCINAFQGMEMTGGILDITLEKITIDEETAISYIGITPGDHLKIKISDTGPGINPEIIDNIFDPYFTTKEVGKGSGLGLSVVHGIVKNHNGAITVDSELGKGTTFTMLFPIVTEKPEIVTETTDELPLGNERILFVDDEKSITKMTGKTLQRLGYQIEIKTNPLEAIELFQSKPDQFDLIITDMTMPQMTGVKLSKKLKEIRSDIPVIICTGHSALLDEEKAKEMGIDAYVMKPIVKQEIAKTIRQVLDT